MKLFTVFINKYIYIFYSPIRPDEILIYQQILRTSLKNRTLRGVPKGLIKLKSFYGKKIFIYNRKVVGIHKKRIDRKNDNLIL